MLAPTGSDLGFSHIHTLDHRRPRGCVKISGIECEFGLPHHVATAALYVHLHQLGGHILLVDHNPCPCVSPCDLSGILQLFSRIYSVIRQTEGTQSLPCFGQPL